ncbi:MAG: ATP phosphoribosyltransferase [Solirubrobacterales bacterium]|nr:ATP phosphoribosyltransferase [Solirubrobacterales bacterium]
MTTTLAIPRGALFEPVVELLVEADLISRGLVDDSRLLVFEEGGIRLLTVRPSDVPTYVEAGAADLGITGKDVLIEQRDLDFVEVDDLRIGSCRMVLAAIAGDSGPAEHERRLGLMKVASKYPRVAREYFASLGRQVEVVELKGSVEIAPVVGLADAIVDLVATGRTLKENGLEEREEIFTSSARLIANVAFYRTRSSEADRIREALRAARPTSAST